MSGSDEMPPSPFDLLNFLCVTLARKPPAVSLRKGAAVARYLDDLVYELAAGPDRERILQLSQAVWGTVFQFSKFKTATKEEAIQFLEDFQRTHLATLNVEAALKTVSSAKILKGARISDSFAVAKPECDTRAWHGPLRGRSFRTDLCGVLGASVSGHPWGSRACGQGAEPPRHSNQFTQGRGLLDWLRSGRTSETIRGAVFRKRQKKDGKMRAYS